jgi:1,4-dihydroxy-2-naphthoyl-CoA hydrolase
MNKPRDTVERLMAAQDDPQAWMAATEAIQQHTATGSLQLKLVRVDAQEIEFQMAITDAARQPFGLLHGGVSMMLAETAASSHAAYGVDLTKALPVGIEINGSHLRPATEGHISIVGRVIRRSASFIVHEVEITHLETAKLLCTARVTNFYKPTMDDGR